MTAPEGKWPTVAKVEGFVAELSAAQGVTLHIANQDLLESALALPHQPYYETFWDKLAAMVRSIAANHALRDGNKRLAYTVLHSTLCVNGYWWLWSQEDGEALTLRIAQGDDDFRWLSAFLERWHILEGDVFDDIPLTQLIEAIDRAREAAIASHPDADRLLQRISGEARGPHGA